MKDRNYRLSSPTEAMQKFGRACTDPLWIQNRFVATGHDSKTPNGTVTFVKLNNSIFILTCEHVVSTAKGDDVPALVVDNIVLDLAALDQFGRFKQDFRFPDKSNIDIAIYQLTPFHWSLFSDRKSKVAVDLNRYREPTWDDGFSYAALGYPTEHKTDEPGNMTATPMAFCVAELASAIGPDKPSFTLHSALKLPHGWHFSGMSGGGIFQIADDGELLPIGVIFEGGPSSKDPDRSSTFAGANELFFRGITLTPDIFRRWLNMAGY